MTVSFAKSSRRFIVITVVSAGVLVFSGCANDPLSATSSPATFTVTGRAYGGEQPISNAAVNFYAASSTGVATSGVYVPPSNVTSMGTVYTKSDGTFSYATALTCTAGQQIYATATGGNTGSGTNSNVVLMAAIGACPTGGSLGAISVDIDEVTTVAAAYALSGFTSMSGTTANVSSSSTNYNTVTTTAGALTTAGLAHAFLNAANLANYTTGTANTTIASPSTGESTYLTSVVPAAEINTIADALQACVNTTGASSTKTDTATSSEVTPAITNNVAASGVSTLTVTAPNANNVQVFGTLGISFTTTGGSTPGTVTQTFAGGGQSLTALATAISNNATFSAQGITASASGAVLTVSAPSNPSTTNYYSFANTTTGQFYVVTLSGQDSTMCGQLFAYLTPPSGTAPTNTLQAMLNLARNPFNNGASLAIFSLVPSSPAFATPTPLSSAPPDWTISIAYQPQVNSPTVYPFYVTTDLSDNVFMDVPTAPLSASTAGILTEVYGVASNGYLNWEKALSTTTDKSGADSSEANGPYALAADNAGTEKLWLPLYPQAAAQSDGYLNASTGGGPILVGLAGTYGFDAKGVAVDLQNNIWWGIANVSKNNLIEYTSPGFGPTSTSETGIGYGPETASTAGTVSIDVHQNVWFTGFATATAIAINVLPNTSGSVSAPTYAGGASSGTTSVQGTGAGYVTLQLSPTSATGLTPQGLAFDASGNAWMVSPVPGGPLFEVAPTYSGNPSAITSLSNTASYSTNAGFSAPKYLEFDGAGNAWIPDSGSTGLIVFNPSTTTFTSEYGGYVPCQVSGTTCETNSWGPKNISIDSTGSIWIAAANANNTGYIFQMIGTASPTFPLLAAAKPSVMP